MQAERTTPERKHVLTKVEAGDYLLPSNDRRNVFRLRLEEETEAGPDSMGREVKCWSVWRWTENASDWGGISDALIECDWSKWELCASWCPSRTEAINEAMRFGTWGDV